MASPIPSHNSAPSPSLTHASSAADDTDLLDAYLDISAFNDAPASGAANTTSSPPFGGQFFAPPAQDEPGVHIQDYTPAESYEPYGFDPDYFWKELEQSKGKDSMMAIDPSSLFSEDNPIATSSGSVMTLDPIMAESSASTAAEATSATTSTPGLSPSGSSPESVVEDDVDYEPQQQQQHQPKRAAATSKKQPSTATNAAGPGRRTRSSASKAATNPHKSVADLALPMKEAAERPQLNHAKKEADDEEHHNHLPHIVFPVPDYIDRPSAEEYAKLSSKEKRQLRNKISARNFRHRRKEYITTLEEEIASRDSTITSLQEEMNGLRTENTTLRTDLDLLKKTVDELLNKARPSSQPAMSSSSNILTPKLNKDQSIFHSKSSFGPGGHTALNSLDVHTLFMPTPSPAAFAAAQTAARRNMNPRLNKLLPSPDHVAHLPGNATDDSFFGSNPYLLDGNHLDSYRASLYGKLTANINGAKADPVNFQPSYFSMPMATPPVRSISSDPLKSGQVAIAGATASAPLSPLRTDGEMEQEVHGAAAAQTARVASLASSTLLSTMFRTFMQTFVGAEPSHLADLVSGRASLCVVANRDAPAASSRRGSIAEIEDIENDLAALSVVDDTRKVSPTKRS